MSEVKNFPIYDSTFGPKKKTYDTLRIGPNAKQSRAWHRDSVNFTSRSRHSISNGKNGHRGEPNMICSHNF